MQSEWKNRGVLSKLLTSKPTEKSLLGRPRRRYEDNIRMDLTGIDVNMKNSIVYVQGRDYWRALVNAAFSFWVP